MRIVLIALAAGLAGCSTAPTVRVPETVSVPVPVACISPEARPQRPALRTQAEILGLDDYRATHALWAAYARALAYVGELEAVVEGCSRLPGAERTP